MPFFVDHEEQARRIIENKNSSIHRVLRDEIKINPERVANVIDYKSKNRNLPDRDLLLANILSGTLDPDKIDYLLRDSLFCGVPFGESVNRDRLISSIKYDSREQRLAITSKGISAVESLIFTNYLMYRNVYWHHAVRSATAMFKRSVQDIQFSKSILFSLIPPNPNDFRAEFYKLAETFPFPPVILTKSVPAL